ncbi:MAG: uridine phosphorylase [Bacilli bacterium]|nr:uridine phosphorylase [Bacilli bacterium]
MENKEVMYHIGLSKKDIKGAKYAILPGDPGRVPKIAACLDEAIKIGQNREYTSYLGKIENEYILVMSTGMGGPSTAIAVEELAQIGIEKLIRVGTCGGMQVEVSAGDLVIAQAAIRQEGTSKEYVPIEYPAVADIDLTIALREAANQLGFTNHIGVVQCKDSFYGQHSPERMPVSYELENKWNAWIKAGALSSEMETASLYIVSSVLRLKAAAILSTVWNQEREKLGMPQETNLELDKEIIVTIKALSNLIKKEAKK